jgi:hypothetical protein
VTKPYVLFLGTTWEFHVPSLRPGACAGAVRSPQVQDRRKWLRPMAVEVKLMEP